MTDLLREERYDQVTSLIERCERDGGLGLSAYDKAYRAIRDDRPDKNPTRCLMLRKLTTHFFDELSHLL